MEVLFVVLSRSAHLHRHFPLLEMLYRPMAHTCRKVIFIGIPALLENSIKYNWETGEGR